MWAPQWTSDDIGGLPALDGMAGADDLAARTAKPKRRAHGRVAARG